MAENQKNSSCGSRADVIERMREVDIQAFCERWCISELALFGSVLREDFRPDSDVDMLVSFEKDARHTLIDLGRMAEGLEVMLGRDVDLVSRRGIETSRNCLRRKAILGGAEVVYGS